MKARKLNHKWVNRDNILDLLSSTRRLSEIVWYRGLMPAGRWVAHSWRAIGRREVWWWTFTWTMCAALGSLALSGSWGILTLLIGIGALSGFAILTVRSPFAGLLSWLVISPMVTSALRYRIPISAVNMGMLGILFLAYLHGLKGNPRPTERDPGFHLTLAAFIAVMLINTMRSPNVGQALKVVVEGYTLPFFLYVFARRWVNNDKALNAVFTYMIFIGVYFAIMGIPEHFLGHTLFKPTLWVEEQLGTVRIQGPADSPIEFGIVVGSAAILALLKLSLNKSKPMQLFYGVLIVVMLAAIALTLRRSVYVGVFLALLCMMIFTRPIRKVIGLMILGSVVLVCMAWPLISHSKVYTTRIASKDPLYSRMIMQSTAINMIKQNPAFGLGVNEYGPSIPKYVVRYGDVMPWHAYQLDSPHNQFLRILVEGGIVTFLPFVLMIFFIIAASVRMYRRTKEPGLLGRDGIVAFWAVSIATLSQSFQSDAWLFCQYMTCFWFFFFGALAGRHLQRRRMDGGVVSSAKPV